MEVAKTQSKPTDLKKGLRVLCPKCGKLVTDLSRHRKRNTSFSRGAINAPCVVIFKHDLTKVT